MSMTAFVKFANWFICIICIACAEGHTKVTCGRDDPSTTEGAAQMRRSSSCSLAERCPTTPKASASPCVPEDAVRRSATTRRQPHWRQRRALLEARLPHNHEPSGESAFKAFSQRDRPMSHARPPKAWNLGAH